MSASKKTANVGTLVNKLERNIALANMRGDKASAAKFQQMLTTAVNSTQMPKVCG